MRKELIDQSAHALAALVALLPAALWPAPASFAWAGFACGFVREITEEGKITVPHFAHALGSWRDLTFWTVGGLLAGVIA